MTKTIMHPVYGAISYEESFWTGKRTLAINGRFLKKSKKNVYILEDGDQSITVTLKGNIMLGVSVLIRESEIIVLPKPTALEWFLSLLPLILVMVWGNSVTLCSIIPVVGGAIGGLVGGAAWAYCACNMRQKPVGQQIIMGLLATVIAFAVCAAIGYILVLGMMSTPV